MNRLSTLVIGVAILSTLGCTRSSYMGISFNSGEVAPEVQSLAQRAKSGDKQAQFELGVRFEEGNGVPTDKQRAIKLNRMAASDGGGTQMMFVPHNGYVQATPVSSGQLTTGLAAAKEKVIRMTSKQTRNPVDYDGRISPFSKEELWEKLRYFIVHYKGEITPQEIEKEFCVKLDYSPYSDGSGYAFSKKSSAGWCRYIGALSGSDKKTKMFVMDWDINSFPESASDIDLSKSYVETSLKGTRWALVRRIDSYGTQSDTYRNGRFILNVYMIGSAIKGINLGQFD